MATANQAPQNAYNRVVSFTTTNLSDGVVFDEPHTTTQPVYAGSSPASNVSVPLTAVNIGNNKWVVPLTSNTSLGAYYLKFHLPQPGSSKMYVTFAQKNTSMADGYYDFINGITDAYRNDFITFCKDGATSIPVIATPFVKKIKFQVYGLDTAQISAAIEYQVWFKTTIGGEIVGGTQVGTQAG